MSTAEDEEYLTVNDFRAWLAEEVRNCLKECDLRIRDATEFTTEYAAGKLTTEEAKARLMKYSDRWRSPLEGIFASAHGSDQEILTAIDKAHEWMHRHRRGLNRDDIQRHR